MRANFRSNPKCCVLILPSGVRLTVISCWGEAYGIIKRKSRLEPCPHLATRPGLRALSLPRPLDSRPPNPASPRPLLRPPARARPTEAGPEALSRSNRKLKALRWPLVMTWAPRRRLSSFTCSSVVCRLLSPPGCTWAGGHGSHAYTHTHTHTHVSPTAA